MGGVVSWFTRCTNINFQNLGEEDIEDLKKLVPSISNLSEEEDNNKQGNDEIQDHAVPVFVRGELVIIVHHQQEGGDDRDRDDPPVKFEFFAEESFHSNQLSVRSNQYGK